jgi:hypothetical protein
MTETVEIDPTALKKVDPHGSIVFSLLSVSGNKQPDSLRLLE